MGKECISCPTVDLEGQSLRDSFGPTTQRLSLSRLAFVPNSKLLRIAVAGACEGGSDTLTTGVPFEITLFVASTEEGVRGLIQNLHEVSAFYIADKPWRVCRDRPLPSCKFGCSRVWNPHSRSLRRGPAALVCAQRSRIKSKIGVSR